MLTGSQIDEINRVYDSRIRDAREKRQARLEEIYKKIPEIKELDRLIIDDSCRAGVLAISGDKEALEKLRIDNGARIAKKEELLKNNGYSKEWIDDVYECPVCKDSGKKPDGRPCDCFYKTVIDLFYVDEKRRTVLEEQNFGNFRIGLYDENHTAIANGKNDRDIMLDTLAIARDFVKNFKARYKTADFMNLLITGEVGAGKTYLANCIAKKLLDDNVVVLYISAIDLFKQMGAALFSGKDEKGLDVITEAECLIVDDLGTEFNTSQVSGFLYELLEERLGRRMPVVFTTNLSFEKIGSHYSERVLSRMRRHFTLLKVPGEDKRLK